MAQFAIAGRSTLKSQTHLRRQAVLIASQLPDNIAEALQVLDYARSVVVEFFDDLSVGAFDNITACSKPPD
jgi:hypothetical protein